MKLPVSSILFFSLALSLLCVQVALPETTYDIGQMERTLEEARELQSTDPVAVADKLAPLLKELRQLREEGALRPDASKILKEALMLTERTQTMLLAPEGDILALIREILVTDPKIDESIFNPREKLLIQKIRSTETGSLNLETNPPGVILSYLGDELGTTPGKFDFIAGTYWLKLSLQGYLDKSVELMIQPAEFKSMSFTMRRKVIDIPIAINAPSTKIRFNGVDLGSSQGYKAWLASLPSEQKAEYEATIQKWKIDTSAFSFFRLKEAPVNETMRIEFQAACYKPLALEIEVKDPDVDWTKTVQAVPQLQNVKLAKDTGYIEVSSTPSEADVWIDGSLQGRTPLDGKEVCSGMHRVQVLSDSGQYVQDVVIQQGRAMRVKGQLKPALAFLGIYEQDPKSDERLPAMTDSKTVAKNLALNCRAFTDPLIAPDDIEALRKKNTLPVDALLQDPEKAVDMDGPINKASAAVGRSELLLIGLHTAKGYLFRLYSTLHPTPDMIEIPSLKDTDLAFLVSQLNRAEKVQDHLQMTDPGLELSDSPKGLVIANLSSAVSSQRSALAPGMVVKSIDEKPMSYRDSQRYLRTKKPEQTVVLEVQTTKDKVSLVPVTLHRVGAEYPWSMPDGFPNAVLAMMRHLVERDPLSDEAKLAALSLGRGFMKLKEWKLALEYLAKANFELRKSGICPGTVLYYQGQCYEEMGNRAQAETYYSRAKDYAEATLGTPNGLSIPVLADQRLQALKR